jgi:NADPH:quinone reductase-like Zn-dependent oxidoreductase
MSYPATHRCVAVVEKGKVSIQEKQLPVLDEEGILVRVRSVALNPMDWKASRASCTPLF